MNDKWKSMFPSRILRRGEDIYESGLVEGIHRTKNGYSATVYGTRPYKVNIVLDADTVIGMDCTCPYAADGRYCKHEAALLMEITYESELEEETETIEDIINSMSEADLRDELFKIADDNSDISHYLFNKYRTKKADASYPNMVYRQLDMLAEIHGDRHGFVDWNSGFDYVEGFLTCLEDMIEPMIERKEYIIAFQSLEKAFQVLNEVDMDGSLGEHTDIADRIQHYWDDLIHLAGEKERDQMYDWFTRMESNDQYMICGDFITYILDNSFTDRKYLLPRLNMVREELKKADYSTWLMKQILNKYKSLLIRCNEDLKEYDEWMRDHSQLESVKEIYLEDALASEDYVKAVQIIEGLLENDENRRNISKWKNKLLDLYRKTEKTEKVKEILIKDVLESHYENMDTIRELKSYCNKEQWEEIREKILLTHSDIRPDFYFEEKMYGELLKLLQRAPARELHYYKNLLMEQYPKEFLHIYLVRIESISTRRGCNSLYNEIEDYLKNASEINDSKEVLVNLINKLIETYPTRKAMIKMLENTKREIQNK